MERKLIGGRRQVWSHWAWRRAINCDEKTRASHDGNPWCLPWEWWALSRSFSEGNRKDGFRKLLPSNIQVTKGKQMETIEEEGKKWEKVKDSRNPSLSPHIHKSLFCLEYLWFGSCGLQTYLLFEEQLGFPGKVSEELQATDRKI